MRSIAVNIIGQRSSLSCVIFIGFPYEQDMRYIEYLYTLFLNLVYEY